MMDIQARFESTLARLRVKPVVVVAAYSRPASLKRLLDSLSLAKYPKDGVKLVLSLDGGASESVISLAESYSHEELDVYVLKHERNLGLKAHILKCGQFAVEEGALILLEDDLIVDPFFYLYACEAAAAYLNEERVGGVALYSPRHNEYANLPFEPLNNGYSAFLMQIPCSWGQLWTKEQWEGFSAWMNKNASADIAGDARLPPAVRAWSSKSWKKYFALYLIEEGKYFSYPYISYTTNCAEPGGEHVSRGSNLFQVPMAHPDRQLTEFQFPSVGHVVGVYDEYFEHSAPMLAHTLNVSETELCVDLNGTKPIENIVNYRYCLTTKNVISRIRVFPVALRPIELSISNLYKFKKACAEVSFCESTQVLEQRTLDKYYGLRSYLSYFNLESIKFVFSLSLSVGASSALSLLSRVFGAKR